MRRNPFRKYRGFLKGSFLNVIAFRNEIIGWVVQDILTVIIMVFMWFAIFKENGGQTINGFTYPQMSAYLIIASLTANWTVNGSTFMDINDDIANGTIATSLTRPISYRAKNFFTSLGCNIGNFVIFFLPLIIIAYLVLIFGFKLPAPEPLNILFYLVSGFLAIAVLDSFDFIIAQLGFVTNSMFGIFLIKGSIFSFLAGSIIPYAYFPAWAQSFLSYLPFASLGSTPVNTLLGRLSLAQVGISLALSAAWAIALYAFSLYANKKMIRHVISVGG